ncbi:MAG: hypothetical protein FWD36_00015 [Treponema sp.]|nr:hypothetical protein [Treponema sp.]
MTMTIEVINNGALNLLSGMERLNLIRVNIPTISTIESGEKLSKQFAGALKLSDAKYESYQNALQESRNEWNRTIY